MTRISFASLIRITLAFLTLMGAPCAMLRADVTAVLLGSAMDKSGAAMSNVKVTATNIDTGYNRTAVTDSTGGYRILALPTGRYKVEAELEGFQKFITDNVVLTVNEQHRVDVTLQVGSLQQSVEIVANTVQVET